MPKQQSIAQARNSLPSLVREVESGGAVELTRRGEPVAVLLGRRQYARLTSRHRRFAEAFEDFARDVDLAELAIDPEKIFSRVREKTRGREVEL